MYITVNDGTKIHYIEKGQGTPLLLIAGGGFSGNIFKYQIDFLAQTRRLFIFDMRAQGKSDRVKHGIRISRLAMDLKEIIDKLEINTFDVMAHSLGCSIIYNYIDLFTCSKIQKAILIDQPAVLTANPIWSREQRLQFGATYNPIENYTLINKMNENEFSKVKKQIIDTMTISNSSDEIILFIDSCFEINPEAASLLYSSNFNQDWRDVIPRINIPTLIIGGRASITPWQSQQWISKNIPGAKLKIFEENEGGNHFMFVENPSLFNKIVAKFFI